MPKVIFVSIIDIYHSLRVYYWAFFVFVWKQKERDVNLLGSSERATLTVSVYPTFYQKTATDPVCRKFQCKIHRRFAKCKALSEVLIFPVHPIRPFVYETYEC